MKAAAIVALFVAGCSGVHEGACHDGYVRINETTCISGNVVLGAMLGAAVLLVGAIWRAFAFMENMEREAREQTALLQKIVKGEP